LLAGILEFELMVKHRDTILQRKEEELRGLKKRRGVTLDPITGIELAG
jgi:hypothetical protein